MTQEEKMEYTTEEISEIGYQEHLADVEREKLGEMSKATTDICNILANFSEEEIVDIMEEVLADTPNLYKWANPNTDY
jgi:hypothetical protein